MRSRNREAGRGRLLEGGDDGLGSIHQVRRRRAEGAALGQRRVIRVSVARR